ncbi:hypothetical protein H0X06_02680 [Candidatus Dependentiae bacterium]|nr:hypothetical protein [Candidatus Dependentiae bacterium]
MGRHKQNEGSLAPKKDWRKGYDNKILDLKKFEQFVKDNQGMAATAMAEKWCSISVKLLIKRLKKKRIYSAQKKLRFYQAT